MKTTQFKAAVAKQAKLDEVMNLIAVPDDGKLMAIEDRRTTPAVEVTVIPTKLTAAEKRKAKSEQTVRNMVADQTATPPKGRPKMMDAAKGPVFDSVTEATLNRAAAESNAKAITKFINSKDEDGAPAEVTTGYNGPMRALRDRVKAGKYTKAANGQPSCGDEVAQILGALEPTEVINACMVAMDITNPYLALNIGQQSMNLRNKLRGQLKRGEIGMGVVREAVEVVAMDITNPYLALSIAKEAAQKYLVAADKYDGDQLEYESKCIRHYCGVGAGICGIDISEIDQIFDDTTAALINSPHGAPTEEDVCRAVIALKEPV